MSIQEVYKSIHQYFYFDKASKAGNIDNVNGKVVHRPMEEKNLEINYEVGYRQSSSSYSGNLDNTK